MTRKTVFIVFLILSVLWLGFIFSNSFDSGKQSSDKSHTVTVVVNQVASSVGVKQEIKESTVRTLAHFAEFAVLGVLVCTDLLLAPLPRLKSTHGRTLAVLCASLPMCFICACIDELIQKFSSGRVSDFSDVLTDSLGALSGIALFVLTYAVCLAVKHKRLKKS